MTLSDTHIRWFRLHRSGLVEPFAMPEAAARALGGIQAQILPAAALSLWNRTSGLTYRAFEKRLYEERSLVKLWGQRHTLHLYPSQEWPLIHSALATRTTWWQRSWQKAGGDLDAYNRAVQHLAETIRHKETLGRSELRDMDLGLGESALSAWGGIFSELVHHGHACHARPIGGEGRFAHREVWLPDLDWTLPAHEAANVELLHRYFQAYGPSTVQDFAYWRGIKVSDARRWVAAQPDAFSEVIVEGQSLLALQEDVKTLQQIPPSPDDWPIRLLYRFDPLLLAHRDKSWLVEPEFYSRVWRPAGHIEGSILERGRLAGTWRYKRSGRGLTLTVFPFRPLSVKAEKVISLQAAGVADFFGLPLLDLAIEEA